jgi:hypothetical protein
MVLLFIRRCLDRNSAPPVRRESCINHENQEVVGVVEAIQLFENKRTVRRLKRLK